MYPWLAPRIATARVIGLVSACVLGASACDEAPAPDSDVDPAGTPGATAEGRPTNLPLKEIMAGLEADLVDVAHGIWIDDANLVSAAATRMADHPTVPPRQMAVIQALLGEEFTAFAQMDRGVHDRAVALKAAADAARPLPELFAGYIDIQNGCLACHLVFRDRVSEALAAEDTP